MTHRLTMVLAVIVALHVAAGLKLGRFAAERAARAHAERLQRALRGLGDAAMPEPATRQLAEYLFRRLGGHLPASAAVRHIVERTVAGLPADAVELRLLDGSGRVFPGQPPLTSAFVEAFSSLDMPWLGDYGIPVPPRRMSRLPKHSRQYAVWRSDRSISADRIGGLMVIADVRRLAAPWLMEHALKTLRRRGENVGVIDRASLAVHDLHLRIPRRELSRQLRNHAVRSQPFVRCGQQTVVLFPYHDGLMLAGAVTTASPVIPPWILGTLVLCVVGACRISSVAGGRMTLATFLGLALSLAAGLPLLLTLGFWQFFHETRLETVTDDVLKDLEQSLIDTDAAFPRLIRARSVEFRTMISDEEKLIASPQQLLRDLALRDLAGRFEALFLVNREGQSLRDYSNMGYSFRRCHDLSPADRIAVLARVIRRGLVVAESTVRMVMKLRPDPTLVNEMWAIKESVVEGRNICEGLGAAGRVLLDRFNQDFGREDTDSSPPKASQLIYGAAMESQTGSIVRWAFASRGRMITLGGGKDIAYILVDILRDPSGVGQYSVIIFSDLRAMEEQFLAEFFSRRRPWAPDTAFHAESRHNIAIFPEDQPGPRCSRYQELLVPPRRLYSEVVDGGKARYLVSAYACRNLANFVLVGVRRWRAVERREAEILRQMAGFGLVMGLLLLAVAHRLYRNVVAPSTALLHGARAMERKTFDHRVPLQTGDEWDEIATLFNRTLEDMEELELARVVQTRLFPTGSVSSATATFLGHNVPTNEVGGDYFDAIPLDDGSLFVVIGDVQGHGLSAALVVAMAKSAFQVFVRIGVRSPAELLRRLNDAVIQQFGRKMSMTFQAALLRPDQTMLFANAGIPYPFLMVPGHPPQEIAQNGFPLGIVTRANYLDLEISVTPGAALVLHTDGILEQRNEHDLPFGAEGLEAALATASVVSPESVIAAVHAGLRQFSGNRGWDDDVTVAVLMVHRP